MIVAALAAGCEAAIGLEDRVFEEQDSQDCRDYCDQVMSVCDKAYSSLDTCLGVCAKLPVGDLLEPKSDNTLACRVRQAELAATNEPEVYCPRAGPTGGGFCGSKCESYCLLFQQTCDSVISEEHCVASCGALRDEPGFDVDRDHDGNTVECRVVHVSSATVAPDPHCGHAQLNSTEYCVDPQDEAPTCEDYCRVVQTACQDEPAVYESEDQCLEVCSVLLDEVPGTNADRSENTLGCRYWHAHNALLDPGTHCPHAGPGGDGVCGQDASGVLGDCVSYCRLVGAACPEGFRAAYASEEACVTACSNEPESFGAQGGTHYSVGQGLEEEGFACRLLHTSRALLDDSNCPAALGQEGCG